MATTFGPERSPACPARRRAADGAGIATVIGGSPRRCRAPHRLPHDVRASSALARPLREDRLVRPADRRPAGSESVTTFRWAVVSCGGFHFTPVGMAAAVWPEP